MSCFLREILGGCEKKGDLKSYLKWGLSSKRGLVLVRFSVPMEESCSEIVWDENRTTRYMSPRRESTDPAARKLFGRRQR